MRETSGYRSCPGRTRPVAVAAMCLAVLLAACGNLRAQNCSGVPNANLRPVAVLSQMDIDGDGVPDGAIDSDCDGLPDNWEAGGVEGPSLIPNAGDRFVGISAPTAIGPGTPPTFIFARLVVATSAGARDTDGDGLTDFVEVFGLKYIDDNNNGILDFAFTDSNANGRFDEGEPINPASEWLDLNGDGLPSIGERPLPNIDPALFRDNDFDGFVFTDPTLADTDGDGLNDLEDRDPLINPRSFGVARGTFERLVAGDLDLDNDGLGNGSDFANDLLGVVDSPSDLGELIGIFRPDRLSDENEVACPVPTIPETLIEDLIGADWDGNGLSRITDVRTFRSGISTSTTCLEQIYDDPATAANEFQQLFLVEGRELFGRDPAVDGADACQRPPVGASNCSTPSVFNARVQNLGWQELLLPAGRSVPFFPDRRVWTVLYSWRMPGFDIDGNGYVGSPEQNFAVDDLHEFVAESNTGIPQLDGRVDATCGMLGGSALMATLAGMWGLRLLGGRRRRA